ncbi:MAG: plsX, partial [Flavipsychrobacter sp.]|nr:plsX [Flavipsychrobacter sp.]
VYGGTPILGINSPVIIGHGVSNALAFKNMIDVARKIVAADLMSVFKKRFATTTTVE